jgi:two-component system, LuxR family, response regulator FixJ
MNIALIDDDEAVLRSLRLLLERRGMKVHCYQSARQFLSDIGTNSPDCVVSDVRMPDVSGLELQHELKQRDSSLPVIFITGHGDIAMAVDAIKAGAIDFFEKPFDDEQLVASIKTAVEKGLQWRVGQNERTELEARIAELSPRQREIMDLVVQGYSNKEIALRLDISPRTVENYRAWVMEKMDARNLADLVRKALMLGGGKS